MPAPRLLFDRFELLPAQRRLLRDDGETIALRSKAFDLLLVLVERAGRLVTKSELLDLAWPGLVVEENNIAAQIVSLRKALGGHLIETVPGRGYRLLAEVREAGGPAAAATATATPPTPQPAAQRLFGRDNDRRRLQDALGAAGCVTLVGPGGVGKTALARAVAADAPAARAAWVDLAALGGVEQLAGALCRALGIESAGNPADDESRIAAALAGGAGLVVLDNAEHLVDAVAALATRLLASSPSLSLLVTSQLPLRIAGERVQALEPLALADDAALPAPALQLILERVRAADPRFPIGVETTALLRRLCERLDGLPLALEMAAAVVPLLGAQGVLDALDQRFAVLKRGRRDAPARHRTLRTAIEWSHGLLPPPAQRVLRRLGVFTSSFSLDLASAVAGDGGDDRWETLDALSELVDRSLVSSLHVDPPRYRLLETMRSFALEQLDAAGETAGVFAKAAAALTATLSSAAERGPADAAVAAELDNVPGLLGWARSHDRPAAVALTVAAAKVATWTPWLSEAAQWVAAGEALLGDDVAPAQQAEWWRELARFQTFVRGPRAVEAARRAVDIERRLGNASGLFWSLVPLLRSRMLATDEFEALRQEAQALIEAHPQWPPRHRIVLSGSLAMEYRRRGDFQSAWLHQQDEAALARSAGLHPIADNADSNLAATLVGLGRHAEALALVDALLARAGDAATPVGAHNRIQRLNALIGLGRLDDAQAAAADALQWAQRFDVLDVFQVLAALSARRGRVRAAAVLLGHYRESLRRRGAELPVDGHAPWRDAQQIAGQALDAPALRGLLERGACLDPADAAALLSTDEPDDVRTPSA